MAYQTDVPDDPSVLTGNQAFAPAPTVTVGIIGDYDRFFVGTLFVPQLRSAVGQPHPLILAYVKAASRQSQGIQQGSV